jgi:hypothetical protein
MFSAVQDSNPTKELTLSSYLAIKVITAPISTKRSMNCPMLNVSGSPFKPSHWLLILVWVAQKLLPMHPVTTHNKITITDPSETAFKGGSLKVPT